MAGDSLVGASCQAFVAVAGAVVLRLLESMQPYAATRRGSLGSSGAKRAQDRQRGQDITAPPTTTASLALAASPAPDDSLETLTSQSPAAVAAADKALAEVFEAASQVHATLKSLLPS